MELKQSTLDTHIVFYLSGKIMGGPDATMLNDQLHTLLEQGHKKIIVDLSQVELMNSSGLGILISGLTTVRNAGGQFKLAGVTDRIRSLLAITKLHTIFEIYDSVQKALEI